MRRMEGGEGGRLIADGAVCSRRSDFRQLRNKTY